MALRIGGAGALVALLLVAGAVAGDDEVEAKLARALEFEDRFFEHSEAGRLAEAEACARACLRLREEALPPEAVELAASRHNLGGLLLDLGRPAEARPLLERALEDFERAKGRDSLDVATVVSFLARAHGLEGRYDAARAGHERALKIREAVAGPRSTDVALSLGALGGVAQEQGRYAEAFDLCHRALAIYEAELGEEDSNVAACVNNLAELLRLQGRPVDAIPYYERAAGLFERTDGPDSTAVAAVLGNLAVALNDAGHSDRARPLFLRSIEICERRLGPRHPSFAMRLGNYGVMLLHTGEFDEALAVLERALAIEEEVLGPEHAAVARTLNNLGDTLRYQGRYEPARICYERAIAIAEKRLGPDHPTLGVLLSNCGKLHLALENPRSARPLLERALEIAERAMAGGDVHIAHLVTDLGESYRLDGEVARARPFYERALALFESSPSARPGDLAAALNNLALVARLEERLESAQSLFERSLRLAEGALGPDHPSLAPTLNNLGDVLCAQGNPAAAREHYVRALAIREKTLDADHPGLAIGRANLAGVASACGAFEEARAHMAAALDLFETHFRRTLAGLQATERLMYGRLARALLCLWLDLAPKCGLTGWEEVLRLRGVVTRAEAAERAILRAGGEDAKRRRDEILALDRELGALALQRPVGARAVEAWRKGCAAKGARREALLLGLARDFGGRRGAEEGAVPGPAQLQASLARGEALLDYFRAGDRYVAFLLAPGGEALRFDLGGVDEVDDAARRYVDAITSKGPAAHEGARLAALVVGPLRAQLPEGTRRLLVCPDSAIAAVPFGALPAGPGGRALLDEYEICYIGMAQEICIASRAPSGGGALVLAGVDYNRAEGAAPAPAASAGRWRRLDGAAREGALVRRSLGEGTLLLEGSSATEANVRAGAKGCSLLHVATHGYVRTDRLANLLRADGDLRRLEPMLERQVAAGQDPMLYSGLVLAGANAGDGGGGDDGLLTSAEVSWLDLGGVDLAVLSACESGRGTPAAGEGTLGLARAFRLAGARRVVASLWKVDDEAAELLMERFYAALRERGLEPAAALREASLALRDFEGAQGDRPFAAPRFWAAFVAYGR